MSGFDVWAPGKRVVELVLDGTRVPMRADAGGWWHADVPDAGPGTRYRYAIDGGEPRPDPRSRWQPEGINGPSALVDHGAFAWTDGVWRGAHLPSAVVYELHVGTFSPKGTFDGVIEHLDDLTQLGVTAIELLPVAEFSGDRGWGYDGVLLWAPHHGYGGPEGLKRLVDAAHARGLAVVLDVVYNHLGPAGNYLGEYGPYFTDRYSTPWGSAVNFDGSGSDGVRRFVIDNARAWLADYHIDGLRLDAVHAIIDNSALHVLEELATSVAELSDQLGRRLWLIAESDRNDPRLVRSPQAGGYGLDASWSDDFHHAIHAALTGDRSGYYVDFGELSQIARAYEKVYVYGRDYSAYRARHHGRPVGLDVAGTAFLGYSQNHDQVGNRADGTRLSALVAPGRLRVAAALVLLAPFVPMLFQGEEWGASTPWLYFTDHHDPELGEAVSAGRRREFADFGWDPHDVPDPQARETWERSVLQWGEADQPEHAALRAWYQSLIALRRSTPDLAGGDLSAVRAVADESAGWLRIERGSVVIVARIGGPDELLAVPLDDGHEHGQVRLSAVLASDPSIEIKDGDARLPPDSVVVLRPLGR